MDRVALPGVSWPRAGPLVLGPDQDTVQLTRASSALAVGWTGWVPPTPGPSQPLPPPALHLGCNLLSSFAWRPCCGEGSCTLWVQVPRRPRSWLTPSCYAWDCRSTRFTDTSGIGRDHDGTLKSSASSKDWLESSEQLPERILVHKWADS